MKLFKSSSKVNISTKEKFENFKSQYALTYAHMTDQQLQEALDTLNTNNTPAIEKMAKYEALKNEIKKRM